MHGTNSSRLSVHVLVCHAGRSSTVDKFCAKVTVELAFARESLFRLDDLSEGDTQYFPSVLLLFEGMPITDCI